MKRQAPLLNVDPSSLYPPEFLELAKLTPAERIVRSSQMWDIYLAYGGTLDPDPDPESPFYDPEASNSSASDGRSGVRVIRRSGI